MANRVRGVSVGLGMTLAAVSLASVAQADFAPRSRHSLYQDRSSKRLALPVPTVSRPTLVRLRDGKLRVVVVVRYVAANWTHRGRAEADRVMVTLLVARGLHSTGPDPASPIFRKAIVHTLHARLARHVYTFVLPVKIARRLKSAGLFAAGGARRRARAAQRVWVDVEQDRDYQYVDGGFDWREGSAATAISAPAHRPAAFAGSADAYAAGSIADNTCTGHAKNPCGYLTVQNQTANGIYCPNGAASATTNGQPCGNYGTDYGSNPGPATVSGSINQAGVNVGVSGSAVQCFVEGTNGSNASNPVGFNNVNVSGVPQPYAPGSVSLSPGGSPAVSSSGFAVTEPIVANDTASPASSNEVAGVSAYMQGALGLVWGLVGTAGVTEPNLVGLGLFAVSRDIDFPTPGSIVMAVLGIAKGVIEDSCDGNANSMALAAAEPGGAAASATFDASKEGWRFLNTSTANGLQLAPSSSTYSPTASSSTSAPPLFLSMYGHGSGVQGSVAGTGANTNEVDLVWADYNPCQQQSNMWGEALNGISPTSTLCSATPPTSPQVSGTYGNVDCGANNYACPDPAAGFPPPQDTASSTGVITLPNGPSNCGTTIPSGTIIKQGYSYTSPNGNYTFVMQTDGNLVLYPKGQPASWAAGTADSEQKNGDGGQEAVLQSDGNLQVIDAKNNVLWQSNTAATKSTPFYSGATISVQNDGNAVLYETPANGDLSIWSTGTNNGHGACPNAQPQPPVQVTTQGCATVMPAGMAMQPGATITSPNGDYTLTMQRSGALVLTGAGTLWSSTQTPTIRKATFSGTTLPGSSAALTYGRSYTDTGNLVVGTGRSSSQISFKTNTASGDSNPGAPGFPYMAVQNDGNFVIYGVEGTAALWASGTLQPGATPCPAPNQGFTPYDA
jgi:hypothetical protein